MAKRIGISLASLKRLENGDPSLSWGAIVRALHVLGELDRLSDLLDTAKDDIGLVLMDEQLPKRIRRKKSTAASGAL